MVLVHLGLLNGPFVPHNLISAQGSSVPLLKFQVVPRLKILLSSGSKRRNPDCIFFPLKKPSQGSPIGPLWRQLPVCRAFLHISQIPCKNAPK